jgi:VanZ family protein
MKLRRPLLHAARIADEVLFYPALALVIWGELSPAQPDAFGLLGAINDKVLHFMSYFGLAAMAAAAVKRRGSAVLAGLCLILLGALLEIVQGYVGRDASIYDEFANIAGVLAGAVCVRSMVEPLRSRLGCW